MRSVLGRFEPLQKQNGKRKRVTNIRSVINQHTETQDRPQHSTTFSLQHQRLDAKCVKVAKILANFPFFLEYAFKIAKVRGAVRCDMAIGKGCDVDSCSIWVPTGVLGVGFPDRELERAIAERPDAIALDAGSTDSGPYYLGAAQSKMTRESVAFDLRRLMLARERLGVPLVIGSCGTSGTDHGVDWTAEICREIARDEGLAPRIALLYSEQSPKTIKSKIASGDITPLAPSADLTEDIVDACDHIVALCGPEPIASAIAEGADIVLSGRTTDTAVLGAVPLMRGFPAGPCWHASKTSECGAFCAESSLNLSGLGGVLFRVDHTGFEIEPVDLDARCTTRTVHAHMLYENSDPLKMYEPGGVLDVSEAVYTQISDRRVRVEQSQFHRADQYTLKLEGAGAVGYQTALLVGIRDSGMLMDIGDWLSRLENFLAAKIQQVSGLDRESYDFHLRAYGWNGANQVPASLEPPGEVGVLFVVTASSQEAATKIAKIANPYLFHFPAQSGGDIPSYAFPFSPAETERGAVYEFKLNHIVNVASPDELIRTRFVEASEPLAVE